MNKLKNTVLMLFTTCLLSANIAAAYSNEDLEIVLNGGNCVGGDLSGADLSNLDLSGRDFSGTAAYSGTPVRRQNE